MTISRPHKTRIAAVVALATALAAPTVASAAVYRWQISNGATVAGMATDWSQACGTQVTTTKHTTMTTAVFGCAASTIRLGAVGDYVYMLAPAYAQKMLVSGSASGNILRVQANSQWGFNSATYGAQLGYVSGGAFTGLGTEQTLTVTATTATTWSPDFSGVANAAVPSGAALTLKVRLVAVSASGTLSMDLLLGTTNANGGTVDVTETVAPPDVAIGNGTNPSNSTITQGQTAAVDAFTLQATAGTAAVTAVTVATPLVANVASLSINGAANCGGTSYGTLSTLVAGSNTIATSGITVGTSATNLWLCVTSAATVTAPSTITGTVTSVTAAGYTSSSADATSATVTINPPGLGVYRWQISNGAAIAGMTTNWAEACGTDPTATRRTTMTTAAFGCASNTYIRLTAAGDYVYMLEAAYAQRMNVTGSATGNILQVQGGATFGFNNAQFAAQLGYVSGGVFTGLGTEQTLTVNNTTATTWNPDFSDVSATVPSGAALTLRVRLVSVSASSGARADLLLGPANANGGTLTVFENLAPPDVGIGNGTNPSNTTISQGQTAAVDAFTLQATSGTATVTDVTVDLPSVTNVASVSINGAANCGGTTYGTLSGLADGTNTITTSGLTVGTSATSLWVCVTSAGSVTAPSTITATVDSATAAGYTSSTADATSATVTINPPGLGVYHWQISNGATIAGMATDWSQACGTQVTTTKHTTMTTAAFGCATSTSIRLTAAGDYVYMLEAAYAQRMIVTGSATGNILQVQGGGFGFNNAQFGAQLGYVSGNVFTGLGTEQTLTVNNTTATTWNPDFSSVSSASIASGAALTLRVRLISISGTRADLLLGPANANGGTLTVFENAAGTITLGNNSGTEASSTTICAAPAVATDVDRFTLLSSGATSVTGITTTFGSNPSGAIGLLEVTNDAGVAQGSLSSPSGLTPAVTGMSFAAPTGAAAQFRLRITPVATLTTSPSFGATVTGVTTGSGFTLLGSDAGSATVTIDGTSSPDVTAASATPTPGTVTANWTNPASGTVPLTDFGSYVVVLGNTVAITGSPAKGTASYTVGAAIGADTVVCAGNVATCVKSGLGLLQTYYLKIFTRDGCANWSSGVQVSATTPNVTTAIADGTNPGAASRNPGGAETPLDAFTLQTSSGTDTVTAATVTLAAGTSAGLSQVRIMAASNCTGTQYGSAVPAGDTVGFTGMTIPVTSTATTFYVCVTPKSHAAMPAPPGGVYAVTGTVTAFTSTNAQVGSDDASATVTIDNASSPDVTAAGTSVTQTSMTASWTNPGAGVAPGTDFGSYVLVLGNTVAVTATPAEGTASYTANGTNTIGSDLIVCAGNVATCQKTGLSAGQTYYMKIFTRDAASNWSAGVAVSATTTDARTNFASLTGAAAACDRVNLSAAYTGDTPTSNNTFTFARGASATGPFTNLAACTGVGGGLNPRTCSDATVVPLTTYYYRVTATDADGVLGTNPLDLTVTTPACYDTLDVAAGTMPGPLSVAAGTSGTPVGRIVLSTSTPGGNPTLTSLAIDNAGTGAPGVDILSLVLLNDADGSLLASSTWNGSRYALGPISVNVAQGSPVTLRLVLNVAAGATVGRTFQMRITAPGDVGVAAPDQPGTSTVTGNVFTVAAGVQAGNPSSNAPSVSIVNPKAGGVVSPGPVSPGVNQYKVQIRVSNAAAQGGIAAITGVQLSTDNGATFPTAAARNSRYDEGSPTVTATVYEVFFTNPPPGSVTLRARASNASVPNVVSEPVQIVVAAPRKGDGNLLVRDNSSQLCTDCHALKSHSSEAVGSKYGAWSVTCRDCHTPHNTRNVMLVNETITPPSVNGQQPAKKVGFTQRTGDSNAAGFSGGKPTATASFTNSDYTGPCQVCHTRTVGAGGAPRWRNSGTTDDHFTQGSGTAKCTDCHSHTGGFAGGTCLECHGTTGPDVDDLGASFWNNSVKAAINTAEWTYSGHGKTSGTYDVTANPAANLPTAPTPGTSECLYCHDDAVSHRTGTNPFRLRGASASGGATAAYSTAAQNAPCLNCHNTGSFGVTPSGQATKNGTKKVDATHDGAKHTAGSLGGKFCWDCHEPHGDRTASGGNVAMIRTNVQVATDGTYGYLGAAGLARTVSYTTDAAGGPAAGRAVESTNTPRQGLCQACHSATKYWRSDGTLATHMSTDASTPYCISCHAHAKQFKGAGDCTNCHASAQPMAAGGTRRAIVAEFNAPNTWGHKRSAGFAVTKWDCIVCHMEGENTNADLTAVHGDGVLNFRDPDTGLNIKRVTFAGGANGGTDPGSYTATATDATPVRFSRNLSAVFDPVAEADTASIMVNLCLKCHDADGAQSPAARVPTSVMPNASAEKPFGTTITTTTAYTGAGVTANGVTGGVTNIKAAFATTNSSYHPILGKQNNWYAKDTRMVAPWNMGVTTRTGTVNATTWGPLLTCWDCHALPADTGTITKTVTAHGGTATVRGNATTSGSSPTSTTGATLCWKCHAGYNGANQNHGTGSAFTSSTNSGMQVFLQYGCNACHSSGYTTAVVRPVRAQDVHGVNSLPAFTSGSASGRWSTDPRPYAFIRDTQLLTNHQPAKIGTTTYSASCTVNGSPSTCGHSMGSYTAGGTY